MAERATSRTRALTYLGVFLAAFATLMLEVLLTRLTSVTGWYHLAFFVISLAMLGMTAGAVLVYLRPDDFRDHHVPARLAQSALAFALTIPVCVAGSLALPLSPVLNFMGFMGLLVQGAILALPFVACGVTMTLALTRSGLPPSTVYGVDLVGAAAGATAVIPVLSACDAPSAAVLAGAVAAVGAACFALARGERGSVAAGVAAALLMLTIANATALQPALRPAWVKGRLEDPRLHMHTRWNNHSRVTVANTVSLPPSFWAKGRNLPPSELAPVDQRMIEIDGAAGTVMTRLGKAGPAAHTYLGWDITSFAHHLRPSGPAAVIGVGGGRDVLEAVRVGHEPVVGIELNQLIVDLHEKNMRAFSGIADLPQVELVSDEARSYLARDRRRYEVIAMSLIDTWASTGTGAYSLSENGLYTAEAWQTFLRRLSPRGVFSVSRWYVVDSPGETARMLALAMETAWRIGAKTPYQHIVLLQNEIVSTLLLSPTKFSSDDIDRVELLATQLGFNMLLTPRRAPSHPLLHELVVQPTPQALRAWAARQESFDFTPPTDARPFFFNMLKPSAWLHDSATVSGLDLTFLGNLAATQTLIYATLASLLLTVLALLLPMLGRGSALRRLPRADVLAALAYFALIGLGFMLVEMGLLSRLTVFLGHPTLALAVLLGGIILFTGIGSLLSGRIDVSNVRWARRYPLLPTGLVLIAAACIDPLMRAFVAAHTPARIAVSLALVAVPALGLGLCFPLGLRLTEAMEARRTADGSAAQLGPWLWGVNGAFGVCASGLGLGLSMTLGIPVTLLCGAACYALLLPATVRLTQA